MIAQIREQLYELFKSSEVHSIALSDPQPTNFIEYTWLWILESYGEFGLFLIFYLSMAFLYALGGLFFYFCDKFHWFQSRKIQIKKYPTSDDIKRCINNLVTNYILIVLPLGIISFPFSRILGMQHSLPLPPVWRFLFDMLLCLIGEDFFHYWMHRFFHTPWFYKNIHKEHHYYTAPFGFTASYAHPVEVVFLGLATFAPAFILRPHFITFYSWFILRQLDAVLTHSGYDIELFPFNLLPTYGGTAFHDYHHKEFTCNYGSRFTWLDKLLGTYKEKKSPTKSN
ncbi:sterol desaturase family protein [Heterostelium album PN500]|uniref:Sterol desaturase family protein n=1 Tax=Heterostelium pallidum (strain ATCC 26659 / Pp 5 / PN500) TaxID=670386 RepID=D3BKN5_HETP5|nr:sterol desaturase family protein [Heterostelium album PN500]EFA78465.1 sterol desaturase family protein [Heterostelium album PN500]|eukprot:XP_020430589.1 sterol desaturase family protein [Heterostelium album PN500]